MQPLTRLLLLAAALALSSCSQPQTPSLCLGCLRAQGDQLFLTAAPNRYWRGAYLYVLARDSPAPGVASHPRIGLIQVTEPESGKAEWYCRPTQPVDTELAAQEGLPIEEYAPDSTLRVGKCWGFHLPESLDAWKESASVITLRIDLGAGEKVQPGKDQFELLGDPILDWGKHTILGFERVGLCTPTPFSDGGLLTSTCLLDRAEWPRFTRERWTRGGPVHLHQKDP